MFRNIYYKTYKNYLKSIQKKKFKYRYLIKGLVRNSGGRNNKGKITSYHRGGGVKSLNRNVNFDYINLYKKNLIKWIVERIEYDGNRSANLVLLKNNFNLKLKKYFNYFFNIIYIYRIANENLKKGDLVSFYDNKIQKFPNINQYSQIFNISTGSEIFNIENIPNTKGSFVRAAGCKAKLLRKYNKNALIILPSKQRKLFSLKNFVSLGRVSNFLKMFKRNYKAGNSRLKNIRPKVRGVAMNPIDHPHGGGEGKTSGGRHSVSKWGILTKGYVTKRKKKKKIKKNV